MTRRIQMIVLVALVVVLAGLAFSRFGRGPELSGVLFANEKYEPLAIPDPKLRLGLLERKPEYKGTQRNIFSASLPVKVLPPPPPPPPGPAQPPVPTGPPPLIVPFRFYGYKEDPQTGQRRAFFTDGENVHIVGIGDTILNRYRVLKINNSSAEVEELATGRKATLQLEQQPQP